MSQGSHHRETHHRNPRQSALIDLRPIAHISGWLLVFMAVLMVVPAALDLVDSMQDENSFLLSAIVTGVIGALLVIATSNKDRKGLDTRQAFLLTFAIWVILPLFGSLPFMLGPPHLGFTDAYFEAVSGITTTGVHGHRRA